MKTAVFSVAAILTMSMTADADSLNYWQAVNGDKNGSYGDKAHWSLNAVPDVGHRAYLNLDDSYTVTFPEGEYKSNAAIKPAVYANRAVEIDGSKTTLVRTYDATGAYPNETFGVYYGGITYAFFNFERYGATPGPNASIDYAISNFHYKVSSAGTNQAKVEFMKGDYNFFDPPGTTWSSAVFPYVSFFGNAGSPLADAEIVFGADTSFRFPTVRMQGNANTNRLVFAGGKHTFASFFYVPYTQGGTAINETDAQTDIRLQDGADVEFLKGTMLGVSGTIRGADRRWRYVLEPGAEMRHKGYVSHYYGHLLLDVAGAWTIDDHFQVNRESLGSSARVIVRDGGVLKTTNKNAEFAMGVKTNPGAESFFAVTNGTVLNSAKMLIGGASFEDAVVENNGQFNIGYGQTPTVATFADSFVTNNSNFVPGWSGDATVNFEGSSARFVGAMYIGGVDTVAPSAATATVNVTSGTFDLYGDAGIIYIGFPAKRYGVFNFKGGELKATRTAPISVGWFGNGEFNLSGGTVSVNHVRTGPTYTSETDGAREDIVRVTGGFLNITSVQKGYGLAISENENRSGRLILDGGVVKCHQLWGAKGKSAFEANGGTLRAVQSVDFQMEGFGEAKLGAKGLTVDCGECDITIAQSFTDKDEDKGEGRLILTGSTGVTKLTGDLSGLSFVELRGGAVDILGKTVQGLVLNGGVLKVDPERPITVNGKLELGNTRLTLADGMTLGNTYSVLRMKEGLDAETLAKWADTVVASGLAEGSACTFSQRPVAGGYELTVEIREAMTTRISLAAGVETRANDYANAATDKFEIDVATDAALTLSGTLGRGSMEKLGGGALSLTGLDNLFIGGWTLKGGKISVADAAALGIGKSANVGTGTLQDGTLELTAAMELSVPLAVAAGTPTNGVVMKVTEEVTMPAPKVTAGSFIKRGAGRLVWTFSDAQTLFSGRGFTTSVGGAWPFSKEQIRPLSFDDANGTVPADGSYGCLNVTDGELVLKGEGAAVNVKGVVVVGNPTRDGSVQPKLTVDNLNADFSSSGMHFVVAPGGTEDNTFVNAPVVTVTNGATVAVDTLSVNRFNTRTDLVTRFVVADRSTLKASYILQPNRSESSAGKAEYEVTGGSRVLAGSAGVSLFRPCKMTFDNSIFAKNEVLEPFKMIAEVGTLGTSWMDATFANGSEFRCGSIAPAVALTGENPIRLTFDDAKWIPVLDADYTFAFDRPEQVSVEVRNRGLVLDVPATRTWTVDHPVTGDGGLVKQGAGTLVLGAGAVAYKGVTRCEAGVIDLNGAALPVVAGGAGLFRNGTFADGGLAVTVDADYQVVERPTLDGVAMEGRVRIDLGRTAGNPLVEPFRPIALCAYTGTAPDVSNWKLKGTGLANVRGIFTARDGVVTVLPERRGVVLIVR